MYNYHKQPHVTYFQRSNSSAHGVIGCMCPGVIGLSIWRPVFRVIITSFYCKLLWLTS